MSEKEQTPKPESRVWITRADAGVTLALAAVFLVAVTAIVVRQHQAGKGIGVVAGPSGSGYQVDLNKAEPPELMLLPGIGKARAERIAAWRRDHGPFETLEQVRRATGLSPAEFERIKTLVTLGEVKTEREAGEQFVSPDTDR